MGLPYRNRRLTARWCRSGDDFQYIRGCIHRAGGNCNQDLAHYKLTYIITMDGLGIRTGCYVIDLASGEMHTIYVSKNANPVLAGKAALDLVFGERDVPTVLTVVPDNVPLATNMGIRHMLRACGFQPTVPGADTYFIHKEQHARSTVHHGSGLSLRSGELDPAGSQASQPSEAAGRPRQATSSSEQPSSSPAGFPGSSPGPGCRECRSCPARSLCADVAAG